MEFSSFRTSRTYVKFPKNLSERHPWGPEALRIIWVRNCLLRKGCIRIRVISGPLVSLAFQSFLFVCASNHQFCKSNPLFWIRILFSRLDLPLILLHFTVYRRGSVPTASWQLAFRGWEHFVAPSDRECTYAGPRAQPFAVECCCWGEQEWWQKR